MFISNPNYPASNVDGLRLLRPQSQPATMSLRQSSEVPCDRHRTETKSQNRRDLLLFRVATGNLIGQQSRGKRKLDRKSGRIIRL